MVTIAYCVFFIYNNICTFYQCWYEIYCSSCLIYRPQLIAHFRRQFHLKMCICIKIIRFVNQSLLGYYSKSHQVVSRCGLWMGRATLFVSDSFIYQDDKILPQDIRKLHFSGWFVIKYCQLVIFFVGPVFFNDWVTK